MTVLGMSLLQRLRQTLPWRRCHDGCIVTDQPPEGTKYPVTSKIAWALWPSLGPTNVTVSEPVGVKNPESTLAS